MSDWYEVYDNEDVQQQTRQRVRRTLLTLTMGLLVTVTIIPMVVVASSTPLLWISLTLFGLALLLAASSRHMVRLRRVVWCLKISVHRVVGYDYARRKTVIGWPEIERLDVNQDCLMIIGVPRDHRPGSVIEIPTLFPDYPRLSHRIVEYAEAHGVPICVDGRPWQLLDLSAVYPFMDDQPVMERPGGPLFGDRDADVI